MNFSCIIFLNNDDERKFKWLKTKFTSKKIVVLFNKYADLNKFSEQLTLKSKALVFHYCSVVYDWNLNINMN